MDSQRLLQYMVEVEQAAQDLLEEKQNISEFWFMNNWMLFLG